MKEVLTAMTGVQGVETSLPTREARVTYDPGKVTPDKLARALTDHKGEHDFTAKVKS